MTGLDDFKLKPRARARNTTTEQLQPFYSVTTNGTTSHYIAPSDFYTIYNYPSSSTINGTGITIAVMGQSAIRPADVAAFRAAAGLSATLRFRRLCRPALIQVFRQAILMRHSLTLSGQVQRAPGATINFIYSTDVINGSLTYAIDTSPTIAPIITISYGGCESGFSSSFVSSTNQLLQMANAKGITVMSSSGDSGATDCDTSGIASEGLNVDFPSSSPYATSAGGTMFNDEAAMRRPTGTPATGSATAPQKATSLRCPGMRLRPPVVWTMVGPGGGGASGFFAKPAWQVGHGVPNDSSRDVPDVSLNAAAKHDGYVVCSQGSCTNGFLSSNGQPECLRRNFVRCADPRRHSRLGRTASGHRRARQHRPHLYGLANGPTASSIFHDITSGNISVVCSQGTPNCPNGGSIGYSAAPGYDLATGLGTLNVNMLINNWASAVPTGTGSTIGAGITTTKLTTSRSLCAITSGTLALTATVTGSITGTTPTGPIQFFVDNVAAGTPQALVSGSATYNLVTTAAARVSSGGHTISTVYSGDANYAGSKGTLLASDGSFASVDIVSTTLKDFSITPCTGSVTVLPGATSTGVVFTITPFNGFTGAVTMAAVNNNLGAFTPRSRSRRLTSHPPPALPPRLS